MLHSVKDLNGYAIQTTDGDIGRVVDFYFDDEGWVIERRTTGARAALRCA